MLLYSPSVRQKDKEWYFERYAYCGKCGLIIGIQIKKEIDETQTFRFKEEEKNNYNYCPHCAERLYKRGER